MMRIPYEIMVSGFERVLKKKGFKEDRTRAAATIFVQNSLASIYSHGLNRFPRVMEYLEKGETDPDIMAECELKLEAFECWNGHKGFGPLNAKPTMGRACELAKEYGISLVAFGNNNHWMRGESYGFQATDQGCIRICWSNTYPNVPVWGGKNRKIGNNPIIFVVPRSNGQHVIIGCVVSQFSYGKIENCKLKGIGPPVPGGYDTKGKPITGPAGIEETRRVFPMGYWKGSEISIALDLIATVLTNGNSVQTVGTFRDKVGLTQVMIAIDPTKANSVELTDKIMDQIVVDVKPLEPVEEGRDVFYPGEPEVLTIRDNPANGISVTEEKWNQVLVM